MWGETGVGKHAQDVTTLCRGVGGGRVSSRRLRRLLGCSAFRGWCFDQPVLEAIISIFGGMVFSP